MNKYTHFLLEEEIVDTDEVEVIDINTNKTINKVSNNLIKLNFDHCDLTMTHPPSIGGVDYMISYKKYCDDFINSDIKSEPILTDEENRFTVFPIKYQTLWDIYKKHLAAHWVAEEVRLSQKINMNGIQN